MNRRSRFWWLDCDPADEPWWVTLVALVCALVLLAVWCLIAVLVAP